jgi:hypothetical protein
MSNSNNSCVSLPPLPTPPVIHLPFGGQISAMADFSVGTPSNCTMTFNLLAQITPVLGSMGCLLGLLQAVGGIKSAITGDFSTLEKGLATLVNCLVGAVAPIVPFAQMLLDIINLIISFLQCFVTELQSIAQIEAGIDLSAAQGDASLMAALTCAQQNASSAITNLGNGIQGLQPLLTVIEGLASIAGTSFTLNIAPPSQGASTLQVVDQLQTTITDLQQIVQTLQQIIG